VSKIKIKLASGNVLEKPLVTCFKSANGSYIVLDNEANGQMGYPIICISKINESEVQKIVDPNEWASVKENLKTIIAGTNLEYLNVPEELNGQDDFYTQLTLPVTSFDLLKNVYSPAAPELKVEETPVAPMPEESAPEVQNPFAAEPATIAPVMPEAPAVVEAPVMDAPAAPAPVEESPITSPVIDTPVVNMDAPVVETSPVIDMPSMPEAAPAIEMPGMPEVQTPVAPALAVETPIEAPVVDVPSNNDEIAALKESFMKSCENMFDALIKKFENK
jgi:hypothetical protein